MTLLKAEGLGVCYGSYTVLHDVSFTLEEGQWLMVAGPNGAGKSTLIGALSRSCPCTGAVTVSSVPAARMKSRDFARRIGVLDQNHFVGYGYTVEEVVRLGRYAYPACREENEAAVELALEQTGLSDLRGRNVLTLSGGELQRTFLAQLFCQNPSVLLLDEPANHLDLIYQKQVFSLVRDWLKTPGRAVLSVVHDLSLALMYGTDALLLHKGQMLGCGPVRSVLSSENLLAAYGMDVYAYMCEMLGQWQQPDVPEDKNAIS